MDDRANEILSRKVAEYTAAVVRGRPCFHVALACDISPYCDCYALNDEMCIRDSASPAGKDFPAGFLLLHLRGNARAAAGRTGACHCLRPHDRGRRAAKRQHAQAV